MMTLLSTRMLLHFASSSLITELSPDSPACFESVPSLKNSIVLEDCRGPTYQHSTRCNHRVEEKLIVQKNETEQQQDSTIFFLHDHAIALSAIVSSGSFEIFETPPVL